MLRVLSGQLKNMKLKVPKTGTRPTSVLLKRKLFDQYIDWSEFIFIDLCAGTGSMAIEALSKGCPSVIAIEKNLQAYLILKENIELARSRMNGKGDISCEKSDFLKNTVFLKSQYSEKKLILFFDPPYENHQMYFEFMNTFNWIGRDSQIWIESDSLKGLSETNIIESYAYCHRKTYTQGSRFIACFTGERK